MRVTATVRIEVEDEVDVDIDDAEFLEWYNLSRHESDQIEAKDIASLSCDVFKRYFESGDPISEVVSLSSYYNLSAYDGTIESVCPA